MGCLRRVLGATLRKKEHRSETCKAQDAKPLLRIERSQLSAMCPKWPRKEFFRLQSPPTGKRPKVCPKTW